MSLIAILLYIFLWVTAHSAKHILAVVKAAICPSIYLFVTPCCHIEMVQARIMKSLLWTAAMALVLFVIKQLCVAGRYFQRCVWNNQQSKCLVKILDILIDSCDIALIGAYCVVCQSAEMVQLKQDVERQKELDTAQELKTKWYLNQLSIETDAHKVRSVGHHFCFVHIYTE